MKLITKNISTVGQLAKALSQLPPDTTIQPFGSEDAALVYDKESEIAYIDEDFSWAEDDELDDELYG